MTTDVDHIVARLGARLVGGPLGGFHNQVFAIDLPATHCPRAPARRLKLFTHRPGVVWFDLRFFPSQDELLESIREVVPRTPAVVRIPGLRLHQFIEGHPLGALSHNGSPLEGHHLFQLTELFGCLAAVPLEILPARRHEHRDGWPRNGDCAGFLRRMVAFTHQDVCAPHEKEYGALLDRLGVPEDCLHEMSAVARRLTPRPFTLLHGDLHRENLIADRAGLLWAIDWELAMIGDPLYDLATHLHLMRYPVAQQAAMIEGWRVAVEKSRPGASAGMEPDLPYYLAYKRIQSVYTDLLREARVLRGLRTVTPRVFRRLGSRVHSVLARAQHALGLARVPSVRTISAVYADWYHSEPEQHSAVDTSRETDLAVTPPRGSSTCPGR